MFDEKSYNVKMDKAIEIFTLYDFSSNIYSPILILKNSLIFKSAIESSLTIS